MLGVLPWLPDLWLDSEDALALRDRAAAPSPLVDRTRVAVVRLPRISNFTDLDALCLEPGLDVVFADSPRALAGADLVVLPGTRATVADLAWLRERGLADAVVAHARRGGAVLGICGGFQMLGRTVADPHGVEGRPGTQVDGLGLLDVCTAFATEKVLRLPTGTALGVDASGYEIHHGRVTRRRRRAVPRRCPQRLGLRDDVARQPRGRRRCAGPGCARSGPSPTSPCPFPGRGTRGSRPWPMPWRSTSTSTPCSTS